MLLNRFKGAMFGLAIGDALGTTIEFCRPGSFEPVTDIVGGGPFNLNPGEWTDDTSLALCLAESLGERKKMDLCHQLDLYLKWWTRGHNSSNGMCFDIGNTTRMALRKYKATKNPYSGSTSFASAGNGSIMRLAPVPLFFYNDYLAAIFASAESSKTTHGVVECVDSCRLLGALIAGAVQGVSKEELLSPDFCKMYWDEDPLTPLVAQVQQGSYKHKNPPDIKGSGYVIESLEAALWAFFHSSDFETSVLKAVNLGDDADTTGAVNGQLAGAFYGFDGIPVEWSNKVAKKDLIEQLTNKMMQSALNMEV